MSLCISQSHRVLSAENKSTRTLTHNARSLTDTYTHTHTSLHRWDLSPHCKAFSPGRTGWGRATLSAASWWVSSNRDGWGLGSPAMRRSHSLTTQRAPSKGWCYRPWKPYQILFVCSVLSTGSRGLCLKRRSQTLTHSLTERMNQSSPVSSFGHLRLTVQRV